MLFGPADTAKQFAALATLCESQAGHKSANAEFKHRKGQSINDVHIFFWDVASPPTQISSDPRGSSPGIKVSILGLVGPPGSLGPGTQAIQAENKFFRDFWPWPE